MTGAIIKYVNVIVCLFVFVWDAILCPTVCTLRYICYGCFNENRLVIIVILSFRIGLQ